MKIADMTTITPEVIIFLSSIFSPSFEVESWLTDNFFLTSFTGQLWA